MRISAISSNNNKQKFGEVKIQPAAYKRIVTSLNLLNPHCSGFDAYHSVLNVKQNFEMLNSIIKQAKDLPDIHIRTVVPKDSSSPLIARVGDEFIHEKLYEPSIGTLTRAIETAEKQAK